MRRLIYVVLFVLSINSTSYAANYWFQAVSVGSVTTVTGTATLNSAAFDKYLGTAVYGKMIARFQSETQDLRYRYDGGTPSSTSGFTLSKGAILELDRLEDIRNFKMLSPSGTTTVQTMYIEAYSD